jgi:transketolase
MLILSSNNVRKRILKMANACGRNAHLGGSLSMVELLTVLYRDVMNYDFQNPTWEERDRFILSKGHCVLALYALFAEAGLLSETEATTFLQDGSSLGSHPVMNPSLGIESSNGSLGQGVSMAVGIAKAAKIQNKSYKVYTLVGNGECNEGSVWEAAMLASQWKLNNLSIILDNNKLQSDGASMGIIDAYNLADRFASFGFDVHEIDGHDEIAIKEAYDADPCDKPKIVIANTIKGKGVSFMEGNNDWHHNRLTDKLYEQALQELKEQ